MISENKIEKESVIMIRNLVLFYPNDRHGIDRSNLDTSVDPRDNFFLYACGGWMKIILLRLDILVLEHFDLLREKETRERLEELVTMFVIGSESKIQGTDAQKVCDFILCGNHVVFSKCRIHNKTRGKGCICWEKW